ncbi:MAG TPA: DNA-directed RNA polymerase subunit beta [Aggregatilinea sp.]|uniref:DNA-directed RNA polymerase subunit beta n=1 Tax=Aggregatilinea sp. TaxID=2806333 RepID=UPI002CDD74BB|nr:DNA-directed RNA polymerase subunit beta [Aggregatilinea sp.]HML22800.1 DNA-directed RNA polymerase subunit beta [Aggregatilinea sp.]
MQRRLDEKNYARTLEVHDLPSLIEIQLDSFRRFYEEGLNELFDEISPIESFNGNLRLYFPGSTREAKEFGLTYWFDEPKYPEETCLERDITFAAPLYVKVALINRAAGDEVVISDIFMGDFPLMTEKGTFIINGSERVVVSQLIRSPGVYFDAEEDRTTGRRLATAKMIPDRGAWMEFETRKSDYLAIKFNRKRTIPVTILLRALAAVTDGFDENSPIKEGTDEELLAIYKEVDNNPDHRYIEGTIRMEPQWDLRDGVSVAEAALLEFYKRMRPGDPPTLDNAREYLESQLFDQRRYDLERVGRYKLNQRLRIDDIVPRSRRTITKFDLVKLVERMILIDNGLEEPDDIDHLGNRRVKTVGELIQNSLRIGLRRMERVIRERMSIRESDNLSPMSLINIRPVVAAVREFFGSSQLSQFMDQTNPLAELTHKRTLSALGPGGLRRERAGFDVRDVHHSHYGRICPIETPEGPNIGLIGRLASYGRVNEYGFIETPYRKVYRELALDDDRLPGRALREDLELPNTDDVIEMGTVVDQALIARLQKAGVERVPVVPFVSDEIGYLSADMEDRFTIAQANAQLGGVNEFVNERVSARQHQRFLVASRNRIDYMDVAPRQIVGISAALIPFLEHDDANRALMGSNMQRQAVPLLQPDVPIVSTGVERQAAYDSGQVLVSDVSGEVVSVEGDQIMVRTEEGVRTFRLRKYNRSNQSTCIDQRPVVKKGQFIDAGQVIADSSSTIVGELALGHDVLCAFLSWEGGNYEDALLISEQLVRDDKFTSIHIEKHEVEARDTKLGPEEITYDIPNVGEDALKDLDEHGIIRVGAEVGPNDILVGKITPKGEKELSPEEKLLRAIFGEKAREVKDSSLRLPHGEKGKVVDVKIFTREEHRDLPAGVDQMVRVSVAQKRKLTQGDKMAGRHGNKGVISKVVAIEDMPFLEDGTAIDIILNPLGVPGRMNIGQVLETHLGWAADRLGFRAITPVFDGADEMEIEAELGRAWLIDRAWKAIAIRAWEWLREEEYDTEYLEDDAEVRRLYIDHWLGQLGTYDMERLALDEIYARRVVLAEWLRELGYDPADVLLFGEETVSLDERNRRDLNARYVTMLMWIDDVTGEMPPDGLSEDELREVARRVSLRYDIPVPIFGKQKLYDGKTGESFDQSVTVGIIHMLKLAHLVEDKVHARSTGPYSLVTQQPLGGKAQFGGQRFGEMEVWALEAYGAAHTLQEMLTVKSDDVQGRVKTYEAIVKGEPIEEPGVPASFRVLVKELQSLGLAVEAITDTGEVIRFGKDEEKARQPRIQMGLLGLADTQ